MEAQLIPYTESSLVSADQGYIDSRGILRPISFSVTEFHYLILRGDRFQAISSLDGSLTQEELLRTNDGMAIGIARDVVRDTNYIFTTKAVFQVDVMNEGRNVWSIYLKKALASGEDRMFDAAFEHSKTKERKNQVMLSRAEFSMENNQLEKAAVFFARSGMPFEDVVLRLLKTNRVSNDATKAISNVASNSISSILCIPLDNCGTDLNPLRLFLTEVLRSLPSSSKSQRTMICTWISEIYLHQITAAAIQGPSKEQVERQRVQEFMDFVRTNR